MSRNLSASHSVQDHDGFVAERNESSARAGTSRKGKAMEAIKPWWDTELRGGRDPGASEATSSRPRRLAREVSEETSGQTHQRCDQSNQTFPEASCSSSRDPEVEAMLAKLRYQREHRQYNRMVRVPGHELGVSRRRRRWDPHEFEGNAGLVSYKQQLGFGMSVITLMVTLFVVGYVAAHHLTEDTAMVRRCNECNPSMHFQASVRIREADACAVQHALGGVLGMTLALVLETIIFIIKAQKLDPQPETLRHARAPLQTKKNN